MPLHILISGTTGESMPPPYAGVQNVSLLYGRTWKKLGHEVGITFVYKPENADDLGANAEYFFEYKSRPDKFKKLLFLVKYFFKNPFLYFHLLRSYLKVCPRLNLEVILYSAYGVYMKGVIATFKPDVILAQAALIKTFMICEVVKNKIPVVFNTYAEVHDLKMGINKNLTEAQRAKYWKYFLNMSSLVIGMDNCSVGPLMYLPPERVKVFYDTCDYTFYRKELSETKEELRNSFALPQDQFLVAMTGAFHYRKGHDQLIKAIAILKKQNLNVGAVIIGGNIGLEKWQDLAKTEDVLDRVYFFQNFSENEKLRMYRCVDAYANLSNSPRSCGLDLALLEAMSSGVPIIVYDNGALPSAVNGKNGFVVPTSDVGAVASAIRKLYEKSPEERTEMSMESSKIASKTDINLTAKIKLDWFNEVIASFRYWGKASKEELEKALAVIEREGWDAFLARYENEFDFTFEENRADWRFIIPITKNFKVLDAGAGLGRISIPLARVVQSVVALDQSSLRIKFLKLRAEKEGLKNIEVCVGDIFDAPFEKESFDLIVMNGLLEWVGATDHFRDPREAQLESLRICKTLLKKDGFLYIGIENRFALSNLSAIDHSGLRFTSFLPRILTNIYTRLRKGKRYDTYTYTKNGYQKLLQESGFSKIDFYLPYPGYNLPRVMIPYENLDALAYAVRSLMSSLGTKRKVARFLAQWPGMLRLYRYLFFSFGIVARK